MSIHSLVVETRSRRIVVGDLNFYESALTIVRELGVVGEPFTRIFPTAGFIKFAQVKLRDQVILYGSALQHADIQIAGCLQAKQVTGQSTNASARSAATVAAMFAALAYAWSYC